VRTLAVITKITTQKRNKDRFNIFIDDGKGERYAFSVHADVLISHHLQKGSEIDEFDIEEICFTDDVNKSVQHALVFLSYRMRSILEVIQHLKEKEYGDPIIQEAVHKLTQLQYLNDEEFAIAYVKTNSKVSLKGPIVLRQELIQKGISATTIEVALSHYSKEDQSRYAKKYSEKTFKKTTSSSEKMQKQKITEALIRKGFTQEIITIVIDETIPERDEAEEWAAICNIGEKSHRRYQKYQGWEYSQRMKQSLYQKGFRIELIERYLQSEECPRASEDMDF
jgi:regulatory protein